MVIRWAKNRRVDLAMLVVYLLALGVMGWYIREVDHRHLERLCQESRENRLVLRRVVLAARRESLRGLTEREARRSVNEVYGRLLVKIPVTPCTTILEGT